MSALHTWFLASRPRTLPAAAVPVAVGSALALKWGVWHPGAALAALGGALALQVGCNFANDYFDWKSGADGPDRLGPTRVTSAGLVSPAQMVRATALVFAVAVLFGLVLVWLAGWPVVAIGLLSVAAAIAYTGGPYPLAYHGLGEVTAFLFFGPVAVLGTFFVQQVASSGILAWPPSLAWWLSLPVGAWVAAILLVNNLRDIPTDALVGKRTLAVRLGARFSRLLYLGLMLVGFLAPLVLLRGGQLWAALLPCLALPLAWGPVRTVFSEAGGSALNGVLAATARVLLVGGLLLAGGLAWG
ncbi:MAG: 1,4-dihydroxy-2-naphthoate polyprenyltransferase [Candidatus Sericytochromatia bacterium]|nr:1,4-dihydroxy-2-naphthoate polyprenyltransferase [Candidatus Sericytochromatia bacterium]